MGELLNQEDPGTQGPLVARRRLSHPKPTQILSTADEGPSPREHQGAPVVFRALEEEVLELPRLPAVVS